MLACGMRQNNPSTLITKDWLTRGIATLCMFLVDRVDMNLE